MGLSRLMRLFKYLFSVCSNEFMFIQKVPSSAGLVWKCSGLFQTPVYNENLQFQLTGDLASPNLAQQMATYFGNSEPFPPEDRENQ